MRIAILGCRGIPARHGGFETFAEGLSARLVEHGHVVTVYCEGRRRGRPRSHRGVHLVYIPVPAVGCLRPLLYDFLALGHASVGHDVVYLLGYGAALFGILPRLLGRSFWINMDGLEWKRSKWSRPARAWFRAMERVAMFLADRVIFDAQAVRADLVARLGTPRNSAVLSYAAEMSLAAPDPDTLRHFGLEADGYHLIVCRLEPENHVLEIIRGYMRAGSRRPLAIVADHTRGGRYWERCRAAGDESVHWLGTVWDREQLAGLRAGAASYAHGHSVGGTNPSLLEAMACANPCLAHDNPFNREVLGDDAFFFTDEQTAAQAFRSMESLSTAERRAMGGRGRARVVTHYGWERLAHDYDTLLRTGRVVRRETQDSAVPSRPRVGLPVGQHPSDSNRTQEAA